MSLFTFTSVLFLSFTLLAPSSHALEIYANSPVDPGIDCSNCHSDGRVWTSSTTLSSPQLSLSVSGTTITLSWTAVPSATGYTLHYTPIPYTPGQQIFTLDMGGKTEFSATLSDGAAYYVALSAYNGSNESGYSNIEQFSISSSQNACIDISGFWEGTQTYNVANCGFGTVVIDATWGTATQTSCDDIVFIDEEGDYTYGSMSQNLIEFTSTWHIDGYTITETGRGTVDDDTMRGTTDVRVEGSGLSCSGTSTFQVYKNY